MLELSEFFIDAIISYGCTTSRRFKQSNMTNYLKSNVEILLNIHIKKDSKTLYKGGDKNYLWKD